MCTRSFINTLTLSKSNSMACSSPKGSQEFTIKPAPEACAERSVLCACTQLINILTLGNVDGVGVFFPKGLLGAITKPTGYNTSSSGNQAYPAQLAAQPADLVTTQVGCASTCVL